MTATLPFMSVVSVTPTVDTSIYASGDLIGTKLTFSNALSQATGSGVLLSAIIADAAKQTSDLELVIFGSNPSSTTFTDQAAFAIADADLSKVQAIILFSSSDRYSYSDNLVSFKGSIAIPVKAFSSTSGAPGRHLYGALVSRGTPTFAAANDVTITVGITQD